MSIPTPKPGAHVERPGFSYSGFIALVVGLALIAAALWLVVGGIVRRDIGVAAVALAILLIFVGILALAGLYTLQPNEAAIMQLFGRSAWWMPEWLSKILPNLAVEPHETHPDGTAKPAVATESE